MALGALEEEEAVVVDLLVAAVQPEEDGDVLAAVVVVELWGLSARSVGATLGGGSDKMGGWLWS